MPVHREKDSKGPYYQWGNHGKRYRYIANNKASRERAYAKSQAQARAIYAHGYKGH